MDFEEWYDNRIWGNEDFKDACWAAWDAAAKAEREACAKVCEAQDTNEAACGRSDSTEVLGVDECPVCGRTWPHPSEQGRCVELFGECVVCRFVPAGQAPNKYGSGAGTDAELAQLSTPNGTKLSEGER